MICFSLYLEAKGTSSYMDDIGLDLSGMASTDFK